MSQTENKATTQNTPQKKFEIKIAIDVYANVDNLPPVYANLLQKAKEAADRAYAPYSQFFVGAAILLDDQTIVQGNNQENAAYPSGLCAERTAIYYTGAQYPDRIIEAIAVVARREEDLYLMAAPCGSCRQAMLEYEEKQQKPIKVILQGENETIYVLNSIADLLPLKFGKGNLEA